MPQQEKIVLLRIETSSGPSLDETSLKPQSDYTFQPSSDNYPDGMYNGFLLLLSLLSLAAWVNNRDRSYLYYSLGIIGTLLSDLSISGFGAELLWTNWGWLR